MTAETLFGLGLRREHYPVFLAGEAPVDFVEVISENFMFDGGPPASVLRQVRGHYPVALHGVSLSIGSAHGLDPEYLERLAPLVDAVEPMVVSDHLSWSRTPGFSSHDLLPLPFTEEALALVARHVDQVQTRLGRQILLENPSTYLRFADAQMPEWEFLAELARRSGCGLLLDVNNVYVSTQNLGTDGADYIRHFPVDHVRQVHLAGHSQGHTLLIDTHDQPVCDAVWQLYRQAMERLGPVAVMIERDDNIPELPELLAELDTARALAGAGVPA